MIPHDPMPIVFTIGIGLVIVGSVEAFSKGEYLLGATLVVVTAVVVSGLVLYLKMRFYKDLKKDD